MSKRDEQKAKTRQIIIHAAFEQFSKGGLINTPTASVAKAAGVSHGTIFAHFPTREDLLDAVIEEFGIRVSERMHELAQGACGMREILQVHLKGISEYENFYIRLISETPLLHEDTKNTLIMIQSAVSFHLTQVAEREMEKHIIKRMPLNLMFNTWLGLIHYYLANRDLFAPEGSVISRYGEEWVQHFMNLISL
ncbi:TetR/AcrR family transcriptional regulator [Aminipila terrae]|uniref:TetR family transcriptional regulator n=1 Tax=Aminipila terrae TaxID=2697030 RepID=A0A6P1MKY8_9FIRM|nr:TetR/AcrR family transcriptional regulator [Aminipila terrae]QHI71645.1 TetR family transcriptional regulator [Aminipila terrae]